MMKKIMLEIDNSLYLDLLQEVYDRHNISRGYNLSDILVLRIARCLISDIDVLRLKKRKEKK